MQEKRSSTRPRPVFWAILGLAIAIRVFLLPLPHTGPPDFYFQTWSRIVTVEGIHTIYNVYDPVNNPPRECQYPPGYLYVLWVLGKFYQHFFSHGFQQETIVFLMILRIPTVLADLALGVMIFLALGRWGGGRAAHVAFAAYVLSPAMILDSTTVTQIDSVQSFLMVGTVLLLVAGKETAAIACLALAALTKPQAIILAPLVLITIAGRGNWRALFRGAATSAGIFLMLALPFILHHKTPELIRTLATPVGILPFLSANAFNLWWLASGGHGWQPDTRPFLGFLTPRHLGLVMLGTAVMLASCRVYFDRSRDSIILSAAFVCFSFYAVCTEMTERYVLVSLPLFLLIAPSARRFARIYVLLSVTAFINLYYVFPLLRISPWDALNLPHADFFYYLQPEVATPLPVLSLDSLASPTISRYISIGVSVIHMIMLGYFAITVSTWRRSEPIPQDMPDS
jgi:dolichyl-phosphate-mannose-protein mannosyltransferase